MIYIFQAWDDSWLAHCADTGQKTLNREIEKSQSEFHSIPACLLLLVTDTELSTCCHFPPCALYFMLTARGQQWAIGKERHGGLWRITAQHQDDWWVCPDLVMGSTIHELQCPFTACEKIVVERGSQLAMRFQIRRIAAEGCLNSSGSVKIGCLNSEASTHHCMMLLSSLLWMLEMLNEYFWQLVLESSWRCYRPWLSLLFMVRSQFLYQVELCSTAKKVKMVRALATEVQRFCKQLLVINLTCIGSLTAHLSHPVDSTVAAAHCASQSLFGFTFDAQYFRVVCKYTDSLTCPVALLQTRDCNFSVFSYSSLHWDWRLCSGNVQLVPLSPEAPAPKEFFSPIPWRHSHPPTSFSHRQPLVRFTFHRLTPISQSKGPVPLHKIIWVPNFLCSPVTLYSIVIYLITVFFILLQCP